MRTPAVLARPCRARADPTQNAFRCRLRRSRAAATHARWDSRMRSFRTPVKIKSTHPRASSRPENNDARARHHLTARPAQEGPITYVYPAQAAGESACRPGSVHPLARAGGHPSGTAVAGSLVRSTREHRAGRPQPLARPRGPSRETFLTLPRAGFAKPPGSLRATSNYALIREIRTVTRPAVPGPCRRQSSACRKRQQPSAPNGAHVRWPGE